MTPSKPIAVALAAMLTLTLFGGVAAASPDTLDCEDDSYSITQVPIETQDHDDSEPGGDPGCPLQFEECRDDSPPPSTC